MPFDRAPKRVGGTIAARRRATRGDHAPAPPGEDQFQDFTSKPFLTSKQDIHGPINLKQ